MAVINNILYIFQIPTVRWFFFNFSLEKHYLMGSRLYHEGAGIINSD